MTDWEDLDKLSWLLRFRVLLWSGLLEATAEVSLRFARQAKLSTYEVLECGPYLQRVFETVLDQSMMRKYERVVEEEEETNEINTEVLENWEFLVKKSGDTKRYRDAFLKDECVYMVERAIADFGVQHGIYGQALTGYVSRALYVRINGSNDGWDPYYPS